VQNEGISTSTLNGSTGTRMRTEPALGMNLPAITRTRNRTLRRGRGSAWTTRKSQRHVLKIRFSRAPLLRLHRVLLLHRANDRGKPRTRNNHNVRSVTRSIHGPRTAFSSKPIQPLVQLHDPHPAPNEKDCIAQQ